MRKRNIMLWAFISAVILLTACSSKNNNENSIDFEDDYLLEDDKYDDRIEDNDDSPIEEAVENIQDIINDAIINIDGWTNVEYSYLEDDAFL